MQGRNENSYFLKSIYMPASPDGSELESKHISENNSEMVWKILSELESWIEEEFEDELVWEALPKLESWIEEELFEELEEIFEELL